MKKLKKIEFLKRIILKLINNIPFLDNQLIVLLVVVTTIFNYIIYIKSFILLVLYLFFMAAGFFYTRSTSKNMDSNKRDKKTKIDLIKLRVVTSLCDRVAIIKEWRSITLGELFLKAAKFKPLVYFKIFGGFALVTVIGLLSYFLFWDVSFSKFVIDTDVLEECIKPVERCIIYEKDVWPETGC